jgi:hypothetical protein
MTEGDWVFKSHPKDLEKLLSSASNISEFNLGFKKGDKILVSGSQAMW